jgi:hypothetical protein
VFLHHGVFVWSRIAGRDELAGSDVLIVHRLLKGTSAAEARGTASRCSRGPPSRRGSRRRALALTAPRSGRVSRDRGHLRPRPRSALANETASRRLDAGGGGRARSRASIRADPATVWAHLTSPKAALAVGRSDRVRGDLPTGRRGVGTLTQCVTGRLATLEEIVDWQPYDHVGWRLAVPDLGPVSATVDLRAVDAERTCGCAGTTGANRPSIPSSRSASAMNAARRSAGWSGSSRLSQELVGQRVGRAVEEAVEDVGEDRFVRGRR